MVVRFLIVFWYYNLIPLYVEADEIDSISCYGYDDGLGLLFWEVPNFLYILLG